MFYYLFLTIVCSKLHLFTTWPQLTDQMVVDSPSYSDLEPMQAHLWAVQIEPSENQSPTPLSQCLFALCKLSTEPLKPCKQYLVKTDFNLLKEKFTPIFFFFCSYCGLCQEHQT